MLQLHRLDSHARALRMGGLLCALLTGPWSATPAVAQQAHLELTAAGMGPTAPGREALQGVRRVLRYVLTAQEAYFAEHQSYTTDVQALRRVLRGSWDDSVEVRILFASRRAWSASAVHPSASGRSCVIFVGTVKQLRLLPSTAAAGRTPEEEGVPMCDAP